MAKSVDHRNLEKKNREHITRQNFTWKFKSQVDLDLNRTATSSGGVAPLSCSRRQETRDECSTLQSPKARGGGTPRLNVSQLEVGGEITHSAPGHKECFFGCVPPVSF